MENLKISNDGLITRIKVTGFFEVSNDNLKKAIKLLKNALANSSALMIFIDKSTSLNMSYTDKSIITRERLWDQISSLAIVAEELSHRILANYLKRVSRGRMQTRVFKREEEAESWMVVCI